MFSRQEKGLIYHVVSGRVVEDKGVYYLDHGSKKETALGGNERPDTWDYNPKTNVIAYEHYEKIIEKQID